MPITDEELKAIFQANDYSTYKPKFDSKTANENDQYINGRAKTLFYISWCRQLGVMGDKPSLKNFTKHYPVKKLEMVDSDIVAEQVVNIMNDQEQLNAVFDIFFSAVGEPLGNMLNAKAASLGKMLDDLTDDEIMESVDKIADEVMNKMINKMMISQSIPEVMQLAREIPAHEDFNPFKEENFDRIDFERKWYHSRTKLGNILSLDIIHDDYTELTKVYEDIIGDMEFESLKESFIASLPDEKDKQIVCMKLENRTQSEIAEAVGLTQGAVAKRLKKIREQLDHFVKL